MNSQVASAAYDPNEAERLAARLDDSLAFKVYSQEDDYIRDAAAMLHRLAHQTPPATQPIATVGEERSIEDHQCWRPRLGRLSHRHWMRDGKLMPTCERCGTPIDREHKETGPVSWVPIKTQRAATLHTPPPVATATAVDAGWQPIETAPRDKSHFLGWDEANGFYEAKFDYLFDNGNPRWATSDWQRRNPTHWMPLPATPTPPAGGQ